MKFLSLASGALLAAILVLNACQPKNKQMWLDDNHTRPKTPCVKNTDSSPDFSYALCKVGPSVVGVEAYYVPEAREDFFGPQSNVSDFSDSDNDSAVVGAGIILDKKGYIITNSHVVLGSNAIKITLMDKRVFMAKVVGIDTVSDLALLKINGKHLTSAPITDLKKLKVGTPVAALGAPFGFQFTLTSGIISAKNRFLADNEAPIPYIQTDTAINEGSSGGPLFTSEGEIVGVNAQIYSRTGGFVGIAFAIPIDVVLYVADQLRTSGRVERVQLGIKADALSEELARTFKRNNAEGALVLDVVGGSRGEDSLKVGDIILAINQQKIEGPEDLTSILALAHPGQILDIQVWRQGKDHHLMIILHETGTRPLPSRGEEPLRLPMRNNFTPQEIAVVEGIDLGLVQPNQELLAYYHLHNGLQIASIGSKAEALGFALGDIIVKVGNQRVESPGELAFALHKEDQVPIFLLRHGDPIFIPYTKARLTHLQEDNE